MTGGGGAFETLARARRFKTTRGSRERRRGPIDGMRFDQISSPFGSCRWWTDILRHALEQHYAAFASDPDRTVLSVASVTATDRRRPRNAPAASMRPSTDGAGSYERTNNKKRPRKRGSGGTMAVMAKLTTARSTPRVQFTTTRASGSYSDVLHAGGSHDLQRRGGPSVWEPRNPIAQALAIFDPRVVGVSLGTRDTDELRFRISWDDNHSDDAVMRRAWTFLEASHVILASGDGVPVVEAWWFGMNPHLADRSPALVLARDGDDGAEAVLDAAREFTLNG